MHVSFLLTWESIFSGAHRFNNIICNTHHPTIFRKYVALNWKAKMEEVPNEELRMETAALPYLALTRSLPLVLRHLIALPPPP